MDSTVLLSTSTTLRLFMWSAIVSKAHCADILRPRAEEGTITIHYVKTQGQLADIETKTSTSNVTESSSTNQKLWSLNATEDLVVDLGVFSGTRFCCIRRPTSQEHLHSRMVGGG